MSQTRQVGSNYLLLCGILAPLTYLGANVVAPMNDPKYDWMSQTVSELSAIDAPTRTLWMCFGIPYGLLLGAFGLGVLRTAGPSRLLRWAGIILIAGTFIGLFWPPMHLREVIADGGKTLTDVLHVVFTIAWAIASMVTMVLASLALGRRFAVFTAVCAVATIGFGIRSGFDAANMEKNLPTPMMGVYERIGIAAFMFWLLVFAIALLKRRS
jgi:hypothetical protein